MYLLWGKKQPTRCRERWHELLAVRTVVREARPTRDTARADTTVTGREEDADASHAELGKQAAYGQCIAQRDRLLVIAK